MGTKGTSKQAENQEKRWYRWICELCTHQWPSLSSHTRYNGLYPQEKLCFQSFFYVREGVPCHSAAAALIPWSFC